MAGDWIKMRTNLRTSPKVVRIASALKADRLRVIGGLHSVWCLFDAHSADGQLAGYTVETLDEDIGWPGFASAMIVVGWLESSDDGLSTPRFDEHNGQSAKRRCQESERKRESRKSSADDADKKRTREEKRREELTSKATTPDGVVVASQAGNAPSGRPQPAAKPECPHQDIIALYHEVLPECPQVRDWTPARAQQLRTRWNEDPRRQNLEFWRQFFEYVKTCGFLVGRGTGAGNRPFLADLEWLTKSQNFTKIREGKYE
jgi:hypothetical protein